MAARREWLLRALWFNCDEVRIARMPRIATRPLAQPHSRAALTSRRRRAC